MPSLDNRKSNASSGKIKKSGEIIFPSAGSLIFVKDLLATNSPLWIRKTEPSATIYSWALNNHWHTNFPLSQEGKIQFRYRILPHNSAYNAASANRFGLEQAQPLIEAQLKSDFNGKPVFAINGSASVIASILKTNSDGKATQLRLRSVSDKDELVKIEWPFRKPASVRQIDFDVPEGQNNISDEVLVPAMGFVTLEALW